MLIDPLIDKPVTHAELSIRHFRRVGYRRPDQAAPYQLATGKLCRVEGSERIDGYRRVQPIVDEFSGRGLVRVRRRLAGGSLGVTPQRKYVACPC